MREHDLLKSAALFLLTTVTAAAVWSAEEAGTTIQPATLKQSALPTGSILNIGYHWEAEKPYEKDYRVFVHIRKEGDNKIIFQADHPLPKATSSADWQGKVDYEKSVKIPEHVADGKYIIVAGLWAPGANRAPLKSGEGVKALGGNSFQIGSFTVDTSSTVFTTILPAEVKTPTVAPGEMLIIGYSWQADKPFDKDYRVFVHIRKEGDNKNVFQADHSLPKATSSADWKGTVSYERSVKVPANLADGKYIIVAGLWAQGVNRPQLRFTDGVKALGGNSYQIGSFTVKTP